MINNNTERKDWRDYKITKVLAYALTGALVLGAVKLEQSAARTAEREFETKYGHLRNQSEDYRSNVVASTVNQEMSGWMINQETRDWAIRIYLDKLRK